MPTFCVTPEELHAFASRLEGLSAALGAAREGGSGYHGACGASRVEHRIDEFFRQWSGGIERVQQGVDNLAKRAAAGANAYATVDSDIEHRAGQGVAQPK